MQASGIESAIRELQREEKKIQEARQLKENLTKVENELDGEYALRLKSERELKEMSQSFESLEKERRDVAAKLLKAEAEAESFRKALSEQKKINAELAKKNEETGWVAKAEYEKLERLLKEKEKEIERLARNSS